MNDELVAKLEAERLTGMPRWQVTPGLQSMTARERRERAETIAAIADADDFLSGAHGATARQRRRREQDGLTVVPDQAAS